MPFRVLAVGLPGTGKTGRTISTTGSLWSSGLLSHFGRLVGDGDCLFNANLSWELHALLPRKPWVADLTVNYSGESGTLQIWYSLNLVLPLFKFFRFKSTTNSS